MNLELDIDIDYLKNTTKDLNLNINSLVNFNNDFNSNSIKNLNRSNIKSNSIIYSVINLDYYKEKDLDELTLSKTLNSNSILMNQEKKKKKTENTFNDYFGQDPIENNNYYKAREIDKVEMKKKKYKKIRIKINKINNFLSKIFKGCNLFENDFRLKEDEIKLIYLILKKKFFKKSSFIMPNIDLKNLKNLINIIKTQITEKRVEEMNKFIFKLTLKQLRKNFYQKYNLIQNEENEIKFFGEFFKTEMDKQIRKKLLEGKNKKLNNSFLKIIFQNSNFKKKFMNYLENELYKDYLELIPKKFKKFLQILKKRMKKTDVISGVSFFCHEFAKKKRVKYPWTSKEVKFALEHFKKLILDLK